MKWNLYLKSILLGGCLVWSISACASSSDEEKSVICSDSQPGVPLCAPTSASSTVRLAINQGNQYFVARRWEEARQQYEAATKAQPDSAEGHYNLGLTLQYLRELEKMKTHFIEAANLAPGHKKIWDSPALRRYGDVPDKKQEATSAPAGGGLGSVFGGGGAMGTGGGRDN